ncbi:hypothetical protein V8G54_033480 [Vigna mungo]|uniref:Uncharacterized protein n=1 Tax=Vigna mungo TaxID=3915 RepID=A0AAQ3RIV3_VIGMU
MLQICWEWFLREEDRGNPVIHAALNLDEVREERLRKTIEDNKRKMVEMNEELRTLAAIVYGGKEDRKQPHFSEHAGTCGVDDDGEPDDCQPNEDGGRCGVDDDGQTNDGEGDDGKAYEDVEDVMEEDKEDVEDILEEDKEDVEDVAPLVARNQQNDVGHILTINPKYLYSLVIPFKLHSR